MVDVVTGIIIDAPLKKVADYASDPDRAPEWYVNIKSAVWQTPKPLVASSKIAFIAEFLGKRLSYIYEVTELSENKMVMRTTDGPFPMETTYLWEKLGENSTRMTLRNRGNPSGFSKLFSPFMALMMKNANRKDLNNIKQILERSGR
jgi:hypothetical protein